MKDFNQKIKRHLEFLYDESEASWALDEIRRLVTEFRDKHPDRAGGELDEFFTEKDTVLITYGDQIRSPDEKPLRTLYNFLSQTVEEEFNILHLLPFFPYSSDAGFAITDYRSVNPEFGDWGDIENIKAKFDLMVDAVINHASRESKWFKRFIKGDPEFQDFFIEIDEGWDLTQVVRPRDNPLITEVKKDNDSKKLWATFSRDQIDLNFANPRVLTKIIDLLLFYVERGATVIRLDAIAYLWKKSGTKCIHLEETHRVIKIFRAVLDLAAPDVALITETNVPHEENVSYFGSGEDEAQMVYQFPLPPLVLDAFIKGDSGSLTEWADELEYPESGGTFFNFLASHDGIGLRPVEGILPKKSIDRMVRRTKEHGGYISYKSDADGSKSPYELNITYFDALSDPDEDDAKALQVDRFMASQAIMLAFRGVPGVYFHSLVGSRNYQAGVEESGEKRAINREKFSLSQLENELSRENSIRKRVFENFKRLLRVRKKESAFHPSAGQRILDLRSEVFGFIRNPDGAEKVICVHSIANERVRIKLELDFIDESKKRLGQDLLTGKEFELRSEAGTQIYLQPYQVLWLKVV